MSSSEEKLTDESNKDVNHDQNDDGTMSLVSHLTELRERIIRSLIAVAIGSCVGYYFVEDIMSWLTKPVGKLYFMQPSEAFFTYIKVAIVAGFLIALPVIFYHCTGNSCTCISSSIFHRFSVFFLLGITSCG